MNNKTNQMAFALIGGRNKIETKSLWTKLENLYPGKYKTGASVSDVAYGEFCIMSVLQANSFQADGELFSQTEWPTTIAEIKENYPELITVLVQSEETPDGDEGTTGCEFVSTSVDTTLFDIIINSCRKDSDALAGEINRQLELILEMSDIFPLPSQIDTTNKHGYDLIADEYKEKYRVTSSNFHTCSTDFLKSVISKHIHDGDKVLEIGPGQNWLVETFTFPEIDYHSIDVSLNMLHYNLSKGKKKVRSSVRYTPFDDNYFDVVIGSLSDPYFFPSALIEIYRILKKGGKFIFTTPSSKWSNYLRDKHMNKTQFARKDGIISEVYSFTMTMEQIEKLLPKFGMEMLEGDELHFIPRKDEFISPALTVAAQNQNIPLSEMVVLNGGVFRK